MADLKTNYKDDVLDASKNEKRKFRMIQNDDGTVSFDDATEYTQQGDAFGAADINATNAKINEQSQSLTYKTTQIAAATYVTQNLKLNKQNRTAYLTGQIIINTTISGNQTALFAIDNECEPYAYKHHQTWIPILGIATNGLLYPFFLRQNCGVYFIEGITYPAGTAITFNEKWLTD